MPWRGPEYPGEFPTLGYIVGEWIEENCIIPDGPQRGQPFKLTGEMWNHLIHRHRIKPRATLPSDLAYPKYNEGMRYIGSQLRRPQKWGKNPFRAAQIWAYALGPCVWDGWDAYGEPVARPVDTPWIAICATSEEQTMNTYAPLYRMGTEGPLASWPGLDVGETRTKLPNGDGWIDKATASAKTILGRPLSYISVTEPHLMVTKNDVEFIANAKRSLDGMGGWWDEDTNAWDPGEMSVGRITGTGKDADVFIDHRATDLPRLTPEEFDDDRIVLQRLITKYGDSCRHAGGWVNERGILAGIRRSGTSEGHARRYFLDEVTAGERVAVNPERWAALTRRGEELKRGEAITLGFDGSRANDSTALIASRISDGRWFTLGIWAPQEFGGKVPEALVEAAMQNAYNQYRVWHMIADPYLWQTVIDKKAGAWGRNKAKMPVVMDFPTNKEIRMDEAIDFFETAFESGDGDFTHDGHPTLTEHALNARIANGKRKPERERADGSTEDHYKKITKPKKDARIDAFIAGILATFGRQLAIENGALKAGAGFNVW